MITSAAAAGDFPAVPAELRPWSVRFSEYRPVDVTPPELRVDGTLAASVEAGLADAATDPSLLPVAVRRARHESAIVPYALRDGYPLNPTGRTGRIGRKLGRWGENKAVDAVLVTGDRQVLLIRRGDTRRWAIPGGRVNPGETASAALLRELSEETGIDAQGMACEVIARAYVDDPRATDWSWLCSTVALFQVDRRLPVDAGADAVDARWWPFRSLGQLEAALGICGVELYPAHRPLLATAHRRLLGLALRASPRN